MKIYIAGKITGLDYEEAESHFMFAETVLEKAGHTPLNPMKLVDQTEGCRYEEYLADALKVALVADAIYMLDNWVDSDGATIEWYIFRRLKKPVYTSTTGLPLGSDRPEPKEI